MGARVYLPTLGRFLQADPVEGGTDNAYAYVNNPITDNDYSGMASWKSIMQKISSFRNSCNNAAMAGIEKAFGKRSPIYGYGRYLFGGGAPDSYSANSIRWKLNVNDKLKGVGTGANKRVAAAITAQGFNDYEHFGDVSGQFVGNISKTANGYTAKGVFVPNVDSYNFDIDPGRRDIRGLGRNTANAIGNVGGIMAQSWSFGIIQPMPYDISYMGEMPVEASW